MSTIAPPVTIPIADIEMPPGTILMVHNVTWEQYEAIVAALETTGQNRRTAYLDHTLEIMSPLPAHERPHRMIGYIVTALLDAEGRDWEDFGSTTFRQRQKSAGLEPDTSFYLDANAVLVRQRLKIDLETDPPADLAIESDVTSSTTLEIYQRLQVPELWIYRASGLKIYLRQDGFYIESDTSRIFPDRPIKTLIPQLVEQAFQLGTNHMLRALRLRLATSS
jgi:Uma2 family endonuclease